MLTGARMCFPNVTAIHPIVCEIFHKKTKMSLLLEAICDKWREPVSGNHYCCARWKDACSELADCLACGFVACYFLKNIQTNVHYSNNALSKVNCIQSACQGRQSRFTPALRHTAMTACLSKCSERIECPKCPKFDPALLLTPCNTPTKCEVDQIHVFWDMQMQNLHTVEQRFLAL